MTPMDSFFGVDAPGCCLPGPYQPFGLVKLGPETEGNRTETTGYRTGEPIRYFTHTHVQGTGGPGRLGNVGVMPFVGAPTQAPAAAAVREERGTASYYSVVLEPAGIEVELTTTARVGVHRYRFPEGADANLRFDAGAVVSLPAGAEGEESARCVGGAIDAVSPTEIVGHGVFQGGWGHNFPYSVYFCAQLDTPAMWHKVSDEPLQCVADFGPVERPVNLRVGVSFVSIEKARASIRREVGGHDSDFDAVRLASRAEWERIFGLIRLEGGGEVQQSLFYSMMYRLFSQPTDLGVDDENGGWTSGVRQFSEIVCLWDSVRNANSFFTLVAPDLERDLLNALIDIADHTGWMPDAWISGHSAQIQGGSSADVLFCEARLKGLEGVDYERALTHMQYNAETPSDDPKLHGRHLAHYRDAGYVPDGVKNCVSRHLEYAYHDWCIGHLAAQLGHADMAAHFKTGSERLWNLWQPELKSFAPRAADGTWVAGFDPTTCRRDCWNDPYFYEGTGMQWSYSAHQDFAGLIERCGGAEAFIARLDDFFVEEAGRFRFGGYHSKETMLHVPYLYIHAGRPDLTQATVRRCLDRFYKPGRKGLSDNEDMGCQSTFYLASTLGLYPVMGQDLYWLTTPRFTRSETALPQYGGTLIIEAPEADDAHIYIASATLNGLPLNRAWLRHREFARGATLRFTLSTTPTAWGRDQLPPAPSY